MTKIIIGPGRLSFPSIFTPMKEEFGGKYGITLLLPPDYDFKPLVAALEAAGAEKWGPDKSKWPKGNFNGPKQVIRDAVDKAHLAGYEPGWKFIGLKNKEQPGVISASLDAVNDPKEAYAGRWVRVSARAFAYDHLTKGVGFALSNIQLLQHDKPFSSGGGRPQDDFDAQAEELGSVSASSWDD